MEEKIGLSLQQNNSNNILVLFWLIGETKSLEYVTASQWVKCIKKRGK